jgi:hypothetical protein
MLADGHLSRVELDMLDRADAHARLGLERPALNAVLHGFCEDLLAGMQLEWADACRVDPRTLAALLAEIDDPALRRIVVELCAAVIEADDHVSDGEYLVLASAVERWNLQREMLQPRQPLAA